MDIKELIFKIVVIKEAQKHTSEEVTTFEQAKKLIASAGAKKLYDLEKKQKNGN